MRELRTLAAMTGGDAAGDAIDPAALRKLVEALASGGHLRAHWSVDDAGDALAVLTSYATYERLRHGDAHARAGRGAAREARDLDRHAGQRRDARLTSSPCARAVTVAFGADHGLVDDACRRLDEIGAADTHRFEILVERGHALDQRDERGRGRGRGHRRRHRADGPGTRRSSRRSAP